MRTANFRLSAVVIRTISSGRLISLYGGRMMSAILLSMIVIDDCYCSIDGFVNCCVSITVLLFLLLLSYLTNCNAINRCHQIELYIILYIFIEDNGWMECTRRRCRGVGRTSAGWWVSYTHTHTHAHREYTIHRHKHIDYSIYM